MQFPTFSCKIGEKFAWGETMKKIVVHCDRNVTEVALMDDRQLVEYYVEHPVERQLVGNIYKGRVVNVLPGMQAAFIDIGQGKNAFLYIDDVLPAHLDKQPKHKPSISQLLDEGQEIVVQVAKEPLGTKGARVTTHFSIPGRWIVYMPNAGYVGVSRKIEREEERDRLKDIGERSRRGEEGLILRTVAEGESAGALLKDLEFLRDLWASICILVETGSAPCLLYRDLDMIPRLVRDIFSEQVDELVIDSKGKGGEIIRFLQGFSPEFAKRVTVYKEAQPIYDAYGVRDELEQAFSHKVRLNNGGYLIVDHTEALTVIDVNTGKFIGSENLEETVFATNLQAAEQTARLIRLRDIGGIIIVDFIDMDKEEHRSQIIEKMEEAIKKDRTKSLVVGWTKLGLLEMTRKKVRENVESILFAPCPQCGGSGKCYAKGHPALK